MWPTKKLLLRELFISQDRYYCEYLLYANKFCGFNFNNKSSTVYPMTFGLSKFIGDTWLSWLMFARYGRFVS